MAQITINGTTDPAFAHLGDVFAQNFSAGLEHGGSVAVVIGGKMVAHLWGGYADAARNHPWTEDTLVNVWSVTKGVVAVAAAMAYDRGQLRYDRPIGGYWPGFSKNGKDSITLDLAMSHRAGLDGLSVPMDEDGLLEGAPYVKALEEMAPLWEPGSRCVYHALTYGHLVGETLRHATGVDIGRFVREEIANRLGASFYIGVPDAEDHRAAEMIEGPGCNGWVSEVLKGPHPHSCRNPTPVATAPNNRRWRAAVVPGGNGHSTAAALAEIFGNTVGGADRLLSSHALREATRLRYQGPDAVFNMDTAWAAGFRMKDTKAYGSRASRDAFGHGGWGGSLAFADPEAKLGFAYVTNRMLGFDDGIDPRRQRLVEAVYDAL